LSSAAEKSLSYFQTPAVKTSARRLELVPTLPQGGPRPGIAVTIAGRVDRPGPGHSTATPLGVVQSRNHTAVTVWGGIRVAALMWAARVLGYKVVGIPGDGLFMIFISPFNNGRHFMAFKSAVDLWTTTFSYGKMTVLVVFVWPISLE